VLDGVFGHPQHEIRQVEHLPDLGGDPRRAGQ
jgi:hypothetical protein